MNIKHQANKHVLYNDRALISMVLIVNIYGLLEPTKKYVFQVDNAFKLKTVYNVLW